MKTTLVIPEKCKALQINFTYELANSIILNSKCVYGQDIKEGAIINVLKRKDELLEQMKHRNGERRESDEADN